MFTRVSTQFKYKKTIFLWTVYSMKLTDADICITYVCTAGVMSSVHLIFVNNNADENGQSQGGKYGL